MVTVLKGLVTPLMLQHALSCFLHIFLKLLSEEVLLLEGFCISYMFSMGLCVLSVIQTAKFHALNYSFIHIPSFVHSFFIHLFVHSFVHSFCRSFIHSVSL